MKNDLMIAAITLFHNRQEIATGMLLKAFRGELPEGWQDTYKEPTPIWAWGCNRWGRDFIEKEFEIREEKRLTFINE